jgi:hypothetical protein
VQGVLRLRVEGRVTLFWCPRCGIVWTAKSAPLCRHYALDVPATRMEPLPRWHPFAKDAA